MAVFPPKDEETALAAINLNRPVGWQRNGDGARRGGRRYNIWLLLCPSMSVAKLEILRLRPG
jgi:hypothetical protein